MVFQQTDEETLKKSVALMDGHSTITSAAAAAGIPRKTLSNRLKRAALKGLMGYKPVLHGFEITKVSSTPTGDFVQQRPERGDEFEIPPGFLTNKMTINVGGDERVIQKWYKIDRAVERSYDILRVVADELKKELPRVSPVPRPQLCNASLLNQFTVTDLHFGMLAWGEETSDSNYNLSIAEKLLLDWFTAAIELAPKAKVGVLAQLGDLMHHDALESVTPAHGNILDADSRLQKIIRVVIRVVRQIIAMMLAKHEHVHVIMASANHDPASSAWMRELMSALYENEPRVTIDRSPDIYYAYEWGRNALFYHHGHKRSIDNVDAVFAGKFRELYGRAKHCYAHIGHLHSRAERESPLMLIERHRTLAPRDAYSNSGGWLSERDAQVITYHEEYGLVGRVILSPEMVSNKVVP